VAAAPFRYLRAASFGEAVGLLEEHGEDARVIAGGQSLVPLMTLGLALPGVLIDITGAGERTVERDGDRLRIAALVRHADLERSPTAAGACAMLPEAARLIGNVRVRHRGTIGGSLAHGEATAEWPCVAVALGATVQVLGPAGERSIAASDLFLTHMTTSLGPAEVITGVELPATHVREGTCFRELARRAGDFALVTAAAVVALGGDGRCSAVRVALGAVADRPLDVSEPAAVLVGEQVDQRTAGVAAAAVAAAADVRPHPHASVDYRREIVAVLVARALLEAAARARNGDRA
jgi:carbon-monoxide dehydrogenase medium subunit